MTYEDTLDAYMEDQEERFLRHHFAGSHQRYYVLSELMLKNPRLMLLELGFLMSDLETFWNSMKTGDLGRRYRQLEAEIFDPTNSRATLGKPSEPVSR